MLSVKRDTRAWSPAEQQSSMKSDGKQTLSATEKDSVLGDKDLGEYLNKVADPNWVDPAKARRVGNPDMDKDAFLKLFLAQLKNQDPTNPMQGHELAAQLAQFSSLEKLSNIDTSLSGMAKKADNKNFDALAMIGKGVAGDSSKIFRNDTKSQHDIEFKLAGPASEVTLSVHNAAGQEIKKFVAKNLKEGANKINWDGMVESGAAAPEGEYNVVIDAKNSQGKKVATETSFGGRVTGVNYTAEGPLLMIGKMSIKMKDVKRIFDGSEIKDDGVKLVEAKAMAGKDAHSLVNPAMMGGNLENIGMAQDLINKIGKEVKTNDAGQTASADGPHDVPRTVVKPESKSSDKIDDTGSNRPTGGGPKIKL